MTKPQSSPARSSTAMLRAGRDPRVAAALEALPRAAFFDGPSQGLAPSPDELTRFVEALEVAETHGVLKIGTGSGYTCAVLARLAREVVAVERDAARAETARQRMSNVAANNVHVHVGDGMNGLPERGPYDRILVPIPVLELPTALLEQLAVGGRLVALISAADDRRRLVRITRTGDALDAFRSEDLGDFRAPPRLGDLLVAWGQVSRAVIEEAMTAAKARGIALGEELLRRGAVGETDLYRALALQRGVELADAATVLANLDPALMARAPAHLLEHYRFVPLRIVDDVLTLATCNPDMPVWEVVQAFRVRRALMQLIPPTDYRRVRTAIQLGHVGATATAPATPAKAQDLLENTADESSRSAATFDALLLDAIAERASDLHLECYEDRARVRFRIDGSLRDIGHYSLSPDELIALINVIKIRAGLDISDRRAPQGGRARRRAGENVFDLRIQTQPSLHGEGLVIRLLPQDRKVPTVEDLGFTPDMAEQYRRLLRNPHGLVLVVGPTGSGKSTTLYAGLQLVAQDPSRKVLTVEDPIEYSLDRIQQTQVNRAVHFDFADAMRAFVREDPDVILVGEIRDGETALETLRASQTGHMVLSTLHCNDAVDAVQRLHDLGMHPNSIASELSAVIAQRLARRVCDGCRVEVPPDPALLAELYPDGPPSDFRCFAGRGCPRCAGLGVRGRVAVAELMPVAREIRTAIARRVLLDELRDLAFSTGMSSLRDSALRLVREGAIPLGEISDVLSAEQMAPRRR